MEWILVAMLTLLAIVLHSPSELEKRKKQKVKKDTI
jgi:hypothetical protein